VRVDVAKLFAEHERAYTTRSREQRDRGERRRVLAIELAVLNAMLTRYDRALFAAVEVVDFGDWRNQRVWAALRELEHAGKHTDGEFLLVDVAMQLAREDRDRDEAMAFGERSDKRQAPLDPKRRERMAAMLATRIVAAELVPPRWEYLHVIAEPPSWVVVRRDAAAIAAAIADLETASLARLALRELVTTQPLEPEQR